MSKPLTARVLWGLCSVGLGCLALGGLGVWALARRACACEESMSGGDSW